MVAAETVGRCLDAIHHGRVAEALPQLNILKAQHSMAPGVDYARALCFLAKGAQRNMLEARQSLLEELRLHPQHRQAQLLLYEVNERVRPALMPPAEVERQHPLFALLCDALLDSTMLAWPRLLHLYTAADRLARGNGNGGDGGHIVECGTAGGGSAVLMAVVLAEREATAISSRQLQLRRVFALDTFTGMPAPGREDALLTTPSCEQRDASATSWGTGTCRSPAEHVRSLARAFAVEDRLVILPGLFETTVPTQLLTHADVQRDGVALLHVDADWYASTRTVLELVVPAMRRGDGAPHRSPPPPRVVQVDDYHHWTGCRKAVDEYLAQWHPSLSPCLEDVDDNAVCFTVPRDRPISAHSPTCN